MSTVGGLSSGTSGAIYGNTSRVPGLASGMDTDGIIESMTIGTQTKIAKQYQQKQLLQWMAEDFQNITSKLISFQNSFTSYSSATNLRSPAFFDKTLITALGENSKYIDISGKSPNIDKIHISAVEQLAQNTGYVSKGNVSDQKLTSGEFDINGEFTESEFSGEYFTFKYDNKDYAVKIPDDKEFNTAEELITSINEELGKIDIGEGRKMSDALEVKIASGKKFEFAIKEDRTDTKLEITGGSDKFLDGMGIEVGDSATKTNSIKGDAVLIDDYMKKHQKVTSFAEMIAGKEKTLSFTYNGVTKTIKMPSLDNEDIFEKEQIPDPEDKEKTKTVYKLKVDKDGNPTALTNYLQDQINKEFGSRRIQLNIEKGNENKFSLNLQTTTPDGQIDNSSVLKVTSGTSDVMKAFDMEYGESNRVNINSSLEHSGIKGFDISKINDFGIHIKNERTGEIITIDKTVDGKEFDAETPISEIIKAINNSDAGVTVSYMETSDKFTLVSKEQGASGDFSIVSSNGEAMPTPGQFNLGTAIFGDVNKDSSQYTYTEGQDAIIWVDYDGEGGDGPVKLTRPSNTFNIDGLSVTVKDEFGLILGDDGKPELDEDGKVKFDPNSEPIKFDAKVDSENVTKAVKDMITAFNEIIELANNEVKEKKNRDYPPLTEQQKKEMTEEQIKQWEEKAKAGMLFNSSELRQFTTDIRFIFSRDAETIKQLEDMGITTSNVPGENGKLSFNEDKFKAALASNPEVVQEVFTEPLNSETTENGITKMNGGIMNQAFEIFNKYASTSSGSKGIFVAKAGAKESPLSLMDSEIQKQMNEVDKNVKELERKLKNEKERYYKQFTSLEMFISNMNTQSGWLAQQFGGF